jgi:hypothetical protein
MLAGSSVLFRAVASAVLVTDAVFLHAAVVRAIYAEWGLILSVRIIAATACGLAVIPFFANSSMSPIQRFTAVATACVSWAAGGFLTDWAFSDGISGQYLMPQWWVTINPGPGCTSGIAFLGGQAVAGMFAGLGLVGPTLCNGEMPFARRIASSLGLIVVASASWMAVFHVRWVT